MKLAFVAVALATSAPRLAQAECANPHWIGTPPHTRLPTHGSLYLYDGSLAYRGTEIPAVAAKWTGMQPKATHETRISDTVVRFDYEATLPATVVIDPEGWEPRPFTFDSRWRAPIDAPRVMQYWHHVYEWTCSQADSVMFQIDQPTAAFRVAWKYAGHTTEQIIPAQTDDGARSVVELGKINCARANLDPEELRKGGELTLTAIRFDGSEVPVVGVPAFLSTTQMPTAAEGLDRAFRLTVLPDPVEETITPTAKEPQTPLVGGIAVICCLFGVLIGIRAGKRAQPTDV